MSSRSPERASSSPLLDHIIKQKRDSETFEALEKAVFDPFWNYLGPDLFVQVKFNGFTGTGKSRLIRELLPRWRRKLTETVGKKAILTYHDYEKSALVAREQGKFTSRFGSVTALEYLAVDEINRRFKGLAREYLRGRVLWVEERVGITQNVDDKGNPVGISRGDIVGDREEIAAGIPTVNFVLTADEELRRENVLRRGLAVKKGGRPEDRARAVGLPTVVQHQLDFNDAMYALMQVEGVVPESYRSDSATNFGASTTRFNPLVVALIHNIAMPHLGKYLYGVGWESHMGALYNPGRMDRRRLRYNKAKLERQFGAYDLLEQQSQRTPTLGLSATLKEFRAMKYYSEPTAGMS